MQETVQLYHETPKPQTAKESVVIYSIALGLIFTPFLTSTIVWILYDWFYAASAFLVGYIVTGIVTSKLRNSSIPSTQLEHKYTTLEIAAWWYLT